MKAFNTSLKPTSDPRRLMESVSAERLSFSLNQIREKMAIREDMKDWVLEALESLGGTGRPKNVAKYIWEHYEDVLKQSGDLLYTWQYDIRWAAQSLWVLTTTYSYLKLRD